MIIVLMCLRVNLTTLSRYIINIDLMTRDIDLSFEDETHFSGGEGITG